MLLLALGIFLVAKPSDYGDTNYTFLIIGVLFSFLSLCGWFHIYSHTSVTAKTFRDMTIVVFLFFFAASLLITLYVLYQLQTW